MAAGYVTNYGNAENDGLSWATPKRSIQSAVDAGLWPLYVKGYFHEMVSLLAAQQSSIDGQNRTIWDGTLLEAAILNNAMTGTIRGMTLQNFTILKQTYYCDYEECIIRNIPTVLQTSDNGRSNKINNCLVYNISVLFDPDIMVKTTVFNSAIRFQQQVDTSAANSNIISSCQIDMKKKVLLQYTLFHNSTLKFTGGGLGTDETTFSAPTGSTDYDKLENLRTRMANVYGGIASQYLIGCKYQTNGALFINPDKGNFFLVPGCQATKMGYDAGFVGRYPEGSTANFASGFISYSNIDANGNVIDQTIDATAETAIFDLGKLRHINSLVALGERAARNGNAINTDADLGVPVYPGTALADGKTYIVRNEAVTQTASGKTRDVGETFIAKASAGLDFTSGTGYVQEVLLNKPRSIEIKASKTDPTLATAAWLKMDLYAEPRVNYDANGVLQYGNLDAGYNAATSERMFIRYWKARIIVKANNLPA